MSPSEFFLKIASLGSALTATFVFVAISAIFLALNPKRAIEARFKESLDHDLFLRTDSSLYGARRLYAMLDAYREADYRAHYKFLYLDFIYPLIYGAAMALILVYLQKQLTPPGTTINEYLVFIPLGAALADYLENISLYLVLRRYQRKSVRAGGLVLFSVAMTSLKMLLFLASLLLIIAGLLKLTGE